MFVPHVDMLLVDVDVASTPPGGPSRFSACGCFAFPSSFCFVSILADFPNPLKRLKRNPYAPAPPRLGNRSTLPANTETCSVSLSERKRSLLAHRPRLNDATLGAIMLDFLYPLRERFISDAVEKQPTQMPTRFLVSLFAPTCFPFRTGADKGIGLGVAWLSPISERHVSINLCGENKKYVRVEERIMFSHLDVRVHACTRYLYVSGSRPH